MSHLKGSHRTLVVVDSLCRPFSHLIQLTLLGLGHTYAPDEAWEIKKLKTRSSQTRKKQQSHTFSIHPSQAPLVNANLGFTAILSLRQDSRLQGNAPEPFPPHSLSSTSASLTSELSALHRKLPEASSYFLVHKGKLGALLSYPCLHFSDTCHSSSLTQKGPAENIAFYPTTSSYYPQLLFYDTPSRSPAGTNSSLSWLGGIKWAKQSLLGGSYFITGDWFCSLLEARHPVTSVYTRT